MPPKRGKKAAPKMPPLEGCCVAIAGSFPGFTQAALKQQITDLGGSCSPSVQQATTHLLTLQAEYDRLSAKVRDAKDLDIPIVSLQWLQDSASSGTKEDEAKYLFNAPSAPQPLSQAPQTNGSSAPPSGGPSRSRKRAASPPPPPSPSSSAPQAKKSRKKTQEANTANGADGTAKSEPAVSKIEPVIGDGQVAKSKTIRVPLDEACPYVDHTVYIDDDGVIYDASLNQTNASNNNNKFYRVQIIHGSGRYRTWTRWGRVGEHGLGSELGDGSLASAKTFFEKKFREKSGLAWAKRGEVPKPGKYAFIERSYEDDDDDGADAGDSGEPGHAREAARCTLEPAILKLMQLIFNKNFIAAAMSDLNYDAEKLPLGKLSTATITRGFQTLKNLSALLDDATLAADYGMALDDAVEHLSNTYYSFIPHAFGRNRPPVIRSEPMLKKEIELLDSLSDMKDTANIMKVDKGSEADIHPLDKQYQGLGMEEMTPLDPAGGEFQQLSDYLMKTRGATHSANFMVEAIFRIERNGEQDRFNQSKFASIPCDRRLLWHGSRSTNFGGILSQGLRIAPPEAPVTGYMFGKGIYLADMSSKSANYCYSHLSDNTALLLLCEAELGDPMQKLTGFKYDAGETAQSNGMVSTWGQGSAGPAQWKDAECVHPSLKGVKIPDVNVPVGSTNISGTSLLYNEYICYDVAQVRLRYLFRVKM